MEKSIQRITRQVLQPNRLGFTSVDMFHTEFQFEPFLVFTEFHMDRPIFGPHPHAGISVMTYMMPDSTGSFLNRDSLGDHSIIEPGGMHVTQAGSGIKHDEVPTITGVDCHGFQIWINHADANRLVEPKAFHASAKEVPEWVEDAFVLRILQGSYRDLSSPIDLVTKTSLFDVTLQPNARLELPAAEMAFIYLLSGTVAVGGQHVSARAMINFTTEGNQVIVQAADETASFIYASGTPHHEPIVPSGPFVMTTDAQMVDTQLRLRRGEMGELDPL